MGGSVCLFVLSSFPTGVKININPFGDIYSVLGFSVFLFSGGGRQRTAKASQWRKKKCFSFRILLSSFPSVSTAHPKTLDDMVGHHFPWFSRKSSFLCIQGLYRKREKRLYFMVFYVLFCAIINIVWFFSPFRFEKLIVFSSSFYNLLISFFSYILTITLRCREISSCLVLSLQW